MALGGVRTPGRTRRMADALAEGAVSAGAEVAVLRAEDAGAEDLVAADAINNPREFMACRKLVPRLERVDPARLADPAVTMQELL